MGPSILQPSLGSAGTFLPSRSPDRVCPAVHPATENPALGSPKNSSTLVLGQEFWFFQQEQADDILGKRYPISGVPIVGKRRNSVLFNFKACTGISEHASWRIVRWVRVVLLSLNPRSQSPPFTLCLPSWAPSYLRLVSILLALHSSLTSSPGTQPSGATILITAVRT